MVVTAARGWRCASAGRRHMQVASGTAAASPSLGLSGEGGACRSFCFVNKKGRLFYNGASPAATAATAVFFGACTIRAYIRVFSGGW